MTNTTLAAAFGGEAEVETAGNRELKRPQSARSRPNGAARTEVAAGVAIESCTEVIGEHVFVIDFNVHAFIDHIG